MWVVVVCPCGDCGHHTNVYGPFATAEEAESFHAPYHGWCADTQILEIAEKGITRSQTLEQHKEFLKMEKENKEWIEQRKRM